MANSIQTYEEYVKDSRIPCKYRSKCYQKNPMHHEKYKHPPREGQLKLSDRHVNKKLKIDATNTIDQKVTDVSDSDTSSDSSKSSDTQKIFKLDCESGSGLVSTKQTTNVSDSEASGNEDKNISSDLFNSDDNIAIHGHLSKVVKEGIDSLEEDNLFESSKHFIKEHFLVDMPNDFFQFWNFCKKLKSSNPLEALKDIGLTLVGPYDVLFGKFNNSQLAAEQYLTHWRYYRDPPELQTILKGEDRTGYHIGYFRDSPDDLPVFVASNHEKRNGTIMQMGGNIFSAVSVYMEDLKKLGDPFKKMHIGRIQSLLNKECEILKLDLSRKTNEMVTREKKVVTRTLNKIGLVVSFDKKTQQGYRELAMDNKELGNLFTKLQNCKAEDKSKYLSELQPVFTFANIAADECDFGTGIELGWNIIAHGVNCLNDTAARFLSTNYRLLNKEAFAKIAVAHMKNRREGCKLSIL